MELKPRRGLDVGVSEHTFNRTSVELKRGMSIPSRLARSTFNRTSVELKQSYTSEDPQVEAVF